MTKSIEDMYDQIDTACVRQLYTLMICQRRRGQRGAVLPAGQPGAVLPAGQRGAVLSAVRLENVDAETALEQNSVFWNWE